MSLASNGNTGPTVSSYVPKQEHVVSSGRRSRRNDRLMWVLMAVVCLAPLPLGSNRPIFWAVLALAIGITGALYFVSVVRSGDALRYPLSLLRVPGAAFVLLCLYLVAQTLPIADLLGLGTIIGTAPHAVVSQSLSVSVGPTLLMLLRQVTYGIFFLLLLQVSMRDGRRSRMLDILLISAVAYALIGLISLQSGDTILGLPKWAYFGSATGTFVNRNSYATFLAFGAVIATTQFVAALFVRAHGEPMRVSSAALYLVALAVLLVTIVATQSRMGLFVAVAGSLTVFALSVVKSSRSGIVVTVLLSVCVVIAAAFLVLNGSGLFERLGGLEKSAAIRFDLYDQIWQMIHARPWTGFGGGTFDLAFPLFHQLPVNPDVLWDKGHNTYLTLWAELGLIAGSLPIIILVVGAIPVVMANAGGNSSWASTAAAIGVLVVGALHSLVDFSLEIQANTFVFLAIVAIGMGAAHQRNIAARSA